jgi:uncharacterized membrane protein (DUF106 family)
MMMSTVAVHLWADSASLMSARSIPLLAVVLLSIVVGFLMVLVFRYTSNQQEIRRAKDRLKAHLLAVRLFQDQLAVVLRSYGRILRGTASYIRLAFTPLLFVIVPMTFLIIYVDHYLGNVPLRPDQQFLLQVQTVPRELDDISLQLPPGLTISAPPVHISASNEVVWRLMAKQKGVYQINVASSGHAVSKQVAVTDGLYYVSTDRLRNHFWTRVFISGEPVIPASSPIASITVQYPERNIELAGFEFNWIILFFIFSLAAGWVFKTVLRIEV